jgi:3-dehydroquinate synthase
MIDLKDLPHASRYVIITDDEVRKLYGEVLQKHLQEQGAKVELLSFPAGEKSKNQETKTMLEHAMLELGCKRDTLIIALGGGVVGDLAGFVAATFMRGIPHVQIPTTLLAMVDSSIGGKTAINTPFGKNLIGAFWPAEKIIIKEEFLKSLPEHKVLDGLVEAVKIFITHSPNGLKFVDENLSKILAKDLPTLHELIERSTALKERVVSRDKREHSKRATLNFGHTVGHAIELLEDYKIMHGHAVALGVLLEAKASQVDGHLSADEYEKVEKAITQLGFKSEELEKYEESELFEAMKSDKKNQDGVISYVVLERIGEIFEDKDKFAHELTFDTLHEALTQLKNAR